jgi:anaerobic magnesium-protoporphyrin IX monomethyl ester cyclase
LGTGQIQSVNLVSSSGCIHECSFCYLRRTQPWAQPINALISDLVGLQQGYGVGYVEFGDDNFPANRPRLEAFCRAMIDSGLGMHYFCLSSVDVLDAEVLDLMCASGLKRIYIGVDGLHPRHIRQLNKSQTTAMARKTIELVRKYPIDLTLAVVLGTSGETSAQIEELYEWVASVGPEMSLCSFLTPYPGTETYHQALKLGFRPPTTLADWGTISLLETPKGLFNQSISAEEYREWYRRFSSLSTLRYKSGIGESVRRLADCPQVRRRMMACPR